jgi:16S rRNA (cytosine967-C5)-methyltransferase
VTPPARLAATIELLGLIDSTPRPADATVSGYFRQRRFIGAKDRAEIAQMAYRIMRRRARLSWQIDAAKGSPTARALALADLLVGENEDPARVARLFAGGAYGPAALDSGEQALAKALVGRKLDHSGMPDSVAVECPPWAEAELKRALGQDFRREMLALTEPAPLDLRVNPLKADRETVLARLASDGIAAEPGQWSPFAIRLGGRPAVMAHPLYKDGAIEIQDEGSQLVALLADARPGQEVVDFCAGAGGKTLAMAASMANKGRLIATDVLDSRLDRARERFRRAGVHNVHTRAISSENDPWIKRHKGSFDRVLVDAPCSGAGTWRRNPDMRWRTLGPGLSELVPLQKRLIASAARLVRPGGRLIYATCSLLPAENEDQADAFLAAHPDFRLKPAADIWREAIWPENGAPEPPSSPWLRLTPARHGTDGFFAAVFEKTAAADQRTESIQS